ncbi:helix-turn-helix domain-containing protein [Nocardiopsis alba]|uniref:helix-turn-helix domain-containing protein n=1 Tax=Nocardiopsis alba TaxID=53437 RepID=UPI0035E164DD
MGKSVSAVQKSFGGELRRAREAANMTQVDAANELQVVPSTISGYERGARKVDLKTIVKLDQAYGANKTLVRKWHDSQRGAEIDPWFQELSVLESSSLEVRDYQPIVWPGLVQTETYARGLTQDVWPGSSTKSIEELVRSRMKRQELLERDDRPLILIVVEEEVIHRRVGGLSKAQMQAQVQRVVHEVEEGTLRVQVIPQGACRHHGGTGPFRVYTFADRPAHASAEHMTSEARIYDSKMVSHCMTVFGLLQGEALSTAESLELLKEALNE